MAQSSNTASQLPPSSLLREKSTYSRRSFVVPIGYSSPGFLSSSSRSIWISHSQTLIPFCGEDTLFLASTRQFRKPGYQVYPRVAAAAVYCNPITVSPYDHNDLSTPSTTSLLTSSTSSDSQSEIEKHIPSLHEQRDSHSDPVLQSDIQVELAKPLVRKMHQTSSRLLRMTDDDRPFTRVSLFHCQNPAVSCRCLRKNKSAMPG